MPTLSYNESRYRQTNLRHIILPGRVNVLVEAILAMLILSALNLSSLNDQVLNKDSGVTESPIEATFGRLFTILESSVIQQVLLFVLWSVAGILIYIVVFRCLQLLLRAENSVQYGAVLLRSQHRQGAWRWLTSLHDFFVRCLILGAGILAVAVGMFVCLMIASQELNNGLADPFPSNVTPLMVSLFTALLSVRLTIVGLSLLSTHFRSWYNS